MEKISPLIKTVVTCCPSFLFVPRSIHFFTFTLLLLYMKFLFPPEENFVTTRGKNRFFTLGVLLFCSCFFEHSRVKLMRR